MSELAFTVRGVPAPQGSKMPWGGEANPHVRSWRQSVADAAHELRGLDGPLLGPVLVTVTFVFPRPKAHYRTGRNAGVLRDTAPFWHTTTPDLDKLQRAIGDALKGTLLRDDSQVAAWSVRKLYGDEPRADLVVRLLALGGEVAR